MVRDDVWESCLEENQRYSGVVPPLGKWSVRSKCAFPWEAKKREKTLNGIIFRIEINSTFANTILFGRSFCYWFLEVGIETEDLFIKSKPSGSIRSFAYPTNMRSPFGRSIPDPTSWINRVLRSKIFPRQRHSTHTQFSPCRHCHAIVFIELMYQMKFIFANLQSNGWIMKEINYLLLIDSKV